MITGLLLCLLAPSLAVPKSIICQKNDSIYYAEVGSQSVYSVHLEDGLLSKDATSHSLNFGDDAKLLAFVSQGDHLLCLVQSKANDLKLVEASDKYLKTFDIPLGEIEHTAASLRNPTYQLLNAEGVVLLKTKGQQTVSPESIRGKLWMIDLAGGHVASLKEPVGIEGRFAQIAGSVYTIAGRYREGQSREAPPELRSLCRITVKTGARELALSAPMQLDGGKLDNIRPYALLDSADGSFRVLSIPEGKRAEILDVQKSFQWLGSWVLPWRDNEGIYDDVLPVIAVGQNLVFTSSNGLKSLEKS